VINQTALTITAQTDTNVYKATTASAAVPVVAGLLGGDTATGLAQTYDTRHVGTGKTLTVSAGYTINDGDGGGNYTVLLVADNTGVITPATYLYGRSSVL